MLHYIPYKESVIAYRVFGHGSLPIFCFHGFSLNSTAYEHLGKYCPPDKRMFALDFPFHGETDWSEKELDAADFFEIFQLIVQVEMTVVLKDFELIGHSMGGRICQYIYQQYSSHIRKVVLLAPDGLVPSFWHYFLFKTPIGPFVFRKMNQSTKFIMRLATICFRIHLINRSFFNLVKSSYEDAETADLIYQRLLITKRFYPNRKRIVDAIRKYDTHFTVKFGQYDKIVPKKLGKYFKAQKLPNLQVKSILSGHLLLANDDSCKIIAEEL